MAQAARVSSAQRFTRRNPCPICTGGDNDRRGRSVRCYGYLSDDGRYAYCTREEYAGTLQQAANRTYKHRLDGACLCGLTHGVSQAPAPRTQSSALASVPNRTRTHQYAPPDAIYDYGTLRFLRYGHGKGKRFVWQHQDGAGDWLDGRDGLQPGLYCAAEVEAADPWEPVFIAEGEKCVDAIRAAGGVATCNPDGAGKWGNIPSDARCVFRNRHVIILADPDEPGRAHAQDIVTDITPIAASVRVLELPNMDVADWLDAGHAFAELRRLAAESAPALNSSRAMQDASPVETPQIALLALVWSLASQLRIAETSLVNIRQERALEERIIALPNETLSAPEKLAAVVLSRELRAPSGRFRERDAQGRQQFYRTEVARRLGVKDQAAGRYMQRLDERGMLSRHVRHDFTDSAIYIGLGPLLDTPEEIQPPQRANAWGGKREKLCPSCGSDNLETRIVCRDCGTLVDACDTNKPVAIIEAERQDNPLPQDTYVTHLVSDEETSACIWCSGELRDYGPVYGVRCLTCDREQPRQT